MKKYIYTIVSCLALTTMVNAQTGIETEDVSSKAILDFPGDGNSSFATKGILLPYVETFNQVDYPSGTLLYSANEDTSTTDDAPDGGKVYVRLNDDWAAMTSLKDVIGTPQAIQKHNTTDFPELANAEGASISDGTVTDDRLNAKGALVLNSNSRALALPKVDGVNSIVSPKAGMICYDMQRKAIAIFDGNLWNFRN